MAEVEEVFAQLSREIEQQGHQGREIRGALDKLNEIPGAVQTGASELSSANRQILLVVSGLSEATARFTFRYVRQVDLHALFQKLGNNA